LAKRALAFQQVLPLEFRQPQPQPAIRDHFALRTEPLGFPRSRPYHKDDNAHVEQKN
jgi:hypothetical protein